MTRIVRAIVLGPEICVPMFEHAICAGFPSPADDFLEDAVDVARLLIANPPATFLWRVEGDSMIETGIFDRDILVVDRSLEPRDGDVVVAIVDGERSLKRLSLQGRPRLAFANGRLPAFEALIAAASRGARRLWPPLGAKLAKAGVILDDLVRADQAPAALIGGRDREKAARMMAAVDAANARFGRGAVISAAAGMKKPWATKFEMRSPRYTTRIDELPVAKTA